MNTIQKEKIIEEIEKIKKRLENYHCGKHYVLIKRIDEVISFIKSKDVKKDVEKENTFRIGDKVIHKVGFYSTLIIIKMDGKEADCRYWNDSKKKYTTQRFHLFELEHEKQ